MWWVALQAHLLSLRNALKLTRSQAIAVRGEAAAQNLQLTKAASAGGAFESFQAALSDAGSDESSAWSGSSTFATSSASDDSQASDSTQSSSSDRTSEIESQPSIVTQVNSIDTSVDTVSIDKRIAPARLKTVASSSHSSGSGAQAASERATGAVGGLDACEGVLVTLDVGIDGYIESELLAAVCLGRISMVADFEFPEGKPNVQRNRRMYSQDDLLACLAACAPPLQPVVNLFVPYECRVACNRSRTLQPVSPAALFSAQA